MLSVARLTATRALTKTCPRAAAATVDSRNMVGFADSMKSKVRLSLDAPEEFDVVTWNLRRIPVQKL